MNWTLILARAKLPEPPGYRETVERVKTKPRIKPSQKTTRRTKRK